MTCSAALAVLRSWRSPCAATGSIAADEQANRVLEDEILEALEGLDVLQANIGTSDQHLKKAQADLAMVRQRVSDEHHVLETELARVTGLSRPDAGLGNRALVTEGYARMVENGVYELTSRA